MARSDQWRKLLKTLGPGIMFAGTCIGGSHLVQSTRAGATYGFELLYFILLANLFKYPFFEFASRYTNATGESILEGYGKIGRWTLWMYAALTFVSMFIVTAAILFVTGGLLGNLFNADPYEIFYWVAGISVIVMILLMTGKFNLLDGALKIIGIVLLISVFAATFSVLSHGRPDAVEGFKDPSPYNLIGFGFIISLMGWMPMGVDMSAWTSLWTQERIKQTGYHPTLKETLLDFNFGYAITVILAVCFLALGTYVFYGSGKELSPSAVTYSNQLVTLFTENIGQWSYLLIASAAFSTMFGTSLTLVDGYTRTIDRISTLLRKEAPRTTRKHYMIWVAVIISGGVLIIFLGTTLKNANGKAILNFKSLIDIATAMSFIIAPVAGWLNHKAIFNKNFPSEALPKKRLKYLSIGGIIFLSAFSLGYIVTFFL